MRWFRKNPENEGADADSDAAIAAAADGTQPGARAALHEAFAGGIAFGTRTTVPPGRAERLGLNPVDPHVSLAASLPFEFLRLGDNRRIGAELAGRIDGLGARVFEFTPEDQGGAQESVGGATSYPYHVAAVELGFPLPWMAVAARRVSQPSHRLYPGRRGQGLGTEDRRINRNYRLYTDDLAAARSLLSGPVNEWLGGALSTRIGRHPIVALEVSEVWAMAAIQANDGLAVPDAVALSRQERLGQPGPWPDALLALLGQFRTAIPHAWRIRRY